MEEIWERLGVERHGVSKTDNSVYLHIQDAFHVHGCDLHGASMRNMYMLGFRKLFGVFRYQMGLCVTKTDNSVLLTSLRCFSCAFV